MERSNIQGLRGWYIRLCTNSYIYELAFFGTQVFLAEVHKSIYFTNRYQYVFTAYHLLILVISCHFQIGRIANFNEIYRERHESGTECFIKKIGWGSGVGQIKNWRLYIMTKEDQLYCCYCFSK